MIKTVCAAVKKWSMCNLYSITTNRAAAVSVSSIAMSATSRRCRACFTRRGNDWTKRFREIVDDAWHIPAGWLVPSLVANLGLQ